MCRLWSHKPDTAACRKISKQRFLGLLGSFSLALVTTAHLIIKSSTGLIFSWRSWQESELCYLESGASWINTVPLEWHDICYLVVSFICGPVIFCWRHLDCYCHQLHSNECFDFRDISVDAASSQLTWIDGSHFFLEIIPQEIFSCYSMINK